MLDPRMVGYNKAIEDVISMLRDKKDIYFKTKQLSKISVVNESISEVQRMYIQGL